MTTNRPLFIPVILGTPRQGRHSEHVARFVFDEVSKREGVHTELIDIRALPFPTDDAGEAIKDPQFSATVN
ncbi:MAG TPA: NAD(P)H-dependent oxidoreductase, partial [Pyrinomonadaceae bacterium]